MLTIKTINYPEVEIPDQKLLHLLAKGLEQKEASKILGISTRSIQNKLAAMRKEYHCRNNVHLFVKLTKVGVI